MPWGSHREFVRLYEIYLHAVYDAVPPLQPGVGRQRLVDRLRLVLRERGVRRVLDCAAGTGFPALRLAVDPPCDDFVIHSTDGDPVMIEHLARQARRLQVPLDGVAPLSSGGRGVAVDPRRFLYNWQDLNRLPDGYDYVMCRGNSLAYANSWAGGRRVTRLAHIAEHLGRMAAKVRPGGWLHVDAPREEDTLDSPIIYPAHGQVAAISEQVTIGADHRVWHLSFKYTTGRVVEFERYSSLLTIEGVEQMLRDLEFEDTEPIELEDERPNFGVIIARRPG